MFKKVLSWLWGADAQVDAEIQALNLEEAYNILNETQDSKEGPDSSSDDDLIEDYDTIIKTGVITSKANENTYVIDGAYKFNSSSTDFGIGSTVTYQLFVSSGIVKVNDVNLVENDWNYATKTKSKWCSRTLVCKVTKRNGRTLIAEPGPITIDLNSVKSEFVPIQGDWINLHVKCEIDESVTNLNGKILEIENVVPVRTQVLLGTVTKWDPLQNCGTINGNVYFNVSILCNGYLPALNDKVVCEIIESEQFRYTWRAVKIIPNDNNCKKNSSDVISNNCDVSFVENRPDLIITNDIAIDFNKLNEVVPFTVEFKNVSESDVALLGVDFKTENCQCRLGDSFKSVTIKAASSYSLVIECVSKNVGVSRELIILKFADCKNVGRWVTTTLKKTYKNFGKFVKKNNSYQERKETDFVRGQNVCQSNRFQAARIPEYKLPSRLLKLVTDLKQSKPVLFQELKSVKPSLFKELLYTNYEDKFHTLLYLDEISSIIAISNYNQTNVCFVPNREYLMLEIENLAEKRPSIIIGDKVYASDPYDPNKATFEGVVHKVGAKHLYLKFNESFHNTYNNEDYSVTVTASRSSYKRLHHGVSMGIKNLGRNLLFPSQVLQKEPLLGLVLSNYEEASEERKAVARNKLEALKKCLPEQNDNAKNEVTPPRKALLEEQLKKIQQFNKQKEVSFGLSSEEGKTISWYNSGLNRYQKEAVKNVLCGVARPLPYLIFGPPGTGKTVTLVETILQILHLVPHSRLLVSAPSNSACDLIALKLIGTGILRPGDIVRLVAFNYVSGGTIPVKLVPYCATANFSLDTNNEYKASSVVNGLVADLTGAALGRHRVTVCTCSTAGAMYMMALPKGHFTHIIVDEAGQTSEPEVMIPLSFFDVSSGQIVLAGDPMQLGPTVLSQIASELGLSESYLERLTNRFPYARDPEGFPDTGGYDPRLVTKLLFNYRSLPPILKLTSTLFYNSDLLPTISDRESKEAAILYRLEEILPKTKSGRIPALVFHGVEGDCFQTPDSPSWFNPDEASQVFYYVNEFYRLGFNSKDIGIISPYVKQVKEIRSVIAEAEFDVPKVGTVEEFQGLEFNIVILSIVRSNNDNSVNDIGFVSSPRRLNVATSRAKSLLLIVGNPQILLNDLYWRSIIKFCIENGAYKGCDF